MELATFSFTYSNCVKFPILEITLSNERSISLFFLTNKSIFTLFAILLFLRMLRILIITSSANLKLANTVSLTESTTGQGAKITSSPSALSRIKCQISSAIKGVKGCINFNNFSKNTFVVSNVFESIGCSYPGLIISKYQEQKSSQTNL